ncbi:MAG: hypothetical protein ACTIJY_08185 [Luteimonas sp.]
MMCLLYAGAAQCVFAQPGPEQAGNDLALEMVVTGVDPATGRDGATYSAKVFVGPQRTRIDVNTPGGEKAYLLLDNDSGRGWAISKQQDAALPLQSDAYRQLQVNPQSPCAQFKVRCEQVGHREIAGVRAQGLRFTGARGRGPGGSHRGEVWIDPGTGLILGYDTQTQNRQVRRMRTTDVRRVALPDAMFQLPVSLAPR